MICCQYLKTKLFRVDENITLVFLPLVGDRRRLNRAPKLCLSSELESSSIDILSLLFVTDDIADEDGLTVGEGKVERDGKARKNQAPDFFHN